MLRNLDRAFGDHVEAIACVSLADDHGVGLDAERDERVASSRAAPGSGEKIGTGQNA